MVRRIFNEISQKPQQAVKMDLETAKVAGDKNPNFLSNKDLTSYLR